MTNNNSNQNNPSSDLLFRANIFAALKPSLCVNICIFLFQSLCFRLRSAQYWCNLTPQGCDNNLLCFEFCDHYLSVMSNRGVNIKSYRIKSQFTVNQILNQATFENMMDMMRTHKPLKLKLLNMTLFMLETSWVSPMYLWVLWVTSGHEEVTSELALFGLSHCHHSNDPNIPKNLNL